MSCTGAIPIPGLPHGPTNPFTYSVLGSAVVHLLAQTLVFGAAAVLVDVGVMQILRRAWAGKYKATHKRLSQGGGPALPASTADGDVVAERHAVRDGLDINQAMVRRRCAYFSTSCAPPTVDSLGCCSDVGKPRWGLGKGLEGHEVQSFCCCVFLSLVVHRWC